MGRLNAAGRPYRPSRGNEGKKWEGELSFVIKDEKTNTIKETVTIKYGFTIHSPKEGERKGTAELHTITVQNPSDFQNKTINDYNTKIKK